MEINKQLFEDVLSGKLEGTFVLRNKNTLHSSHLSRIADLKYQYMLCGNSYTSEGMFISNDKTHPLNIEDFIPETNMKENELKITIPENHEIDWQESVKQEKIVFKKKDTKPRSWEEYYEQQIANKKCGYYIDDINCDSAVIVWDDYVGADKWKNVLPSKELAEAFLAMMQLMSLRQAWIGDWKPDWKNPNIKKWCIIFECELKVSYFYSNSRALSFPSREMAEDFMDCFRDLLEIAKPLL